MRRAVHEVVAIVVLCAALPAAGHVIEIDGIFYNPHNPLAPPIELLVLAPQPSLFDVIDLGGCEATISVSHSGSVVVVSPLQSNGAVVSQVFSVTALPGVTDVAVETISVGWVGRDAGGQGPCQEIFGTEIVVTVVPPLYCDDAILCTDDSFDPEADACQNEPADCDDRDATTVDICNEDTGACANEVPASGVCKAYVLIGNFNGTPGEGFYTGRAVGNTADEAESDYENAGYTVVRIDQARSRDLFTALNDPETKAIWFLGHGAYESTTGLLGFEKLGDPTEGLEFLDRYVEPRLVRAGTGQTTFPNIEQVTLHACDQDLQGWRDMFPTAVSNGEFDAWTVPIKGVMYYWWQIGATYPQVCQTASATLAPASIGGSPPIVHPTLEPLGTVDFHDPFFVLNLEAVTNRVPPFVLETGQAAAFEGRSFNFWIGYSSGPRLLFSTSIVGGSINVAAQSVDPDPTPDFEITITDDAFRSLLEQPSAWDSLTGTSAITISNQTGGSLSDGQILDAMNVIMLPEPSLPLTLMTGAAMLVGMGLRRSRAG